MVEDSEDSEEEEKKNAVLVDNVRGIKTAHETRNILCQLQAYNTSEKCAVRKALEEEEDTVSSWDSEYTPGTILEVDARLSHASKNQNIKGSISLEQQEDLKENSEYKGSPDKSKEGFDPRSLEQFAPAIVLGVDARLTHASKNQNIKGSISLGQHKDLKQISEFKRSSDRSKEHFDARYQGQQETFRSVFSSGLANYFVVFTDQHAPGSILERVTRLIRAWRNKKIKCSISLGQHEEVGKSPLKEDEAAEASAEQGSGSDTGSKVGVVLEKPVPKKPSEPPVQKEEAKQKVAKSPLKEDEAAEASAEPGSASDTGSNVGVVLEKPVPKKPSEPTVQKEEAKQTKKGKG
ncbi:uncharacterized protein LOC100919184 [Sarcophilus harrisii]|uniref:uncharacterized protein LOC100919184 n=1 Tax=Sarcophilus harrisii TaxID=9305 RepID=UPI001301F223|nr:uncharacterized protein LOC100919184 [Sarcophilus harrisii]